jgi:hypothetical protein
MPADGGLMESTDSSSGAHPQDAIRAAFRAFRANGVATLSDQWTVNRLCYELAEIAMRAVSDAGFTIVYLNPTDDTDYSALFEYDDADENAPQASDA